MGAPTFTLVKSDPNGVANAPNGKIRVFANVNNSLLYTIDEAGVIRPNGVGTATELATNGGDPVIIDSDGTPPNIGDILIAIVGPSNPRASWQPNPGSVQIVAEQVGPLALAAITTTQLILVDISGGSATGTLPDAAGELDKEIWVKVTSVASGNNCTLTPDAGDTIDGAATYVLDTDYEWVKLRSDNTNWIQVG